MNEVTFGIFVVAIAAGGLTLALRALRAAPTLPPPGGVGYAVSTTQDAAYRAMSRLFDEGDRDFLRRQRLYTPRLERRLRRQRQAAMRLYLRQIRGEFLTLFNAGRELVKFSPSSDFSSLLLRQAMLFHSLYVMAVVQVSLDPRWTTARSLRPVLLFDATVKLREAVRALAIEASGAAVAPSRAA